MKINEEDCLAYDPFAGDFGTPGDRTLRNKLVKARKGGKCCYCLEEIIPGSVIRSQTEIFDEEIHTYRFCTACCEAMAKSWEDNGESIEERAALGQAAATKARMKCAS